MALNIKDPAVHDAVREIARITGESQAQAVATAVNDRLRRLQADDLAERLLDIARSIRSRLGSEGLPDHGELLYDEYGLPK